DQHWGINIKRSRPQAHESIYWILVPKQQSGWSSRFGELRGVQDVGGPVRLQLLPYLAGFATLTSPDLIRPGDPFTRERDFSWRAGLDAQFGIGSNFTVDATVYPDFGQVEADPAVVNLTASEVFLEERRPFFLEGARLLEGKGPYFYFSRR